MIPDLKVCKVGAHASVSATAKANVAKRLLLVLFSWCFIPGKKQCMSHSDQSASKLQNSLDVDTGCFYKAPDIVSWSRVSVLLNKDFFQIFVEIYGNCPQL